jgi:hypothetical protein
MLLTRSTAVKEPTGIAKITLTKVEVANIDAPPAHASPEKYLDPFRDFPTTRCRDLSITFEGGGTPAFVKLTDRWALVQFGVQALACSLKTAA